MVHPRRELRRAENVGDQMVRQPAVVEDYRHASNEKRVSAAPVKEPVKSGIEINHPGGRHREGEVRTRA